MIRAQIATRSSALTALAAGALFAVGLSLAGMGHPSTVIDAFRFDASWDPRLYLMFLGAVLVQASTYRWISRRGTTLRGAPLQPAAKKAIDARLVIGSVIFGVGWGLGGLCPGPAALVVLSGAPHAVLFFLSMSAGLAAYHFVFERSEK